MTEPRPESDDYDLLTFGEVAARLTEELAESTAQLARARAQTPPDAGEITRLDSRIALLRESGDRYRQEQRTNETFSRRFGSLTGPPTDQRPGWR